jgi:hypothetical protein
MKPETPSDVPANVPDIHVWMTLPEAAEALDTSLETVNLRVREGDLESRLSDHGTQQVLVCLPKTQTGTLAVSNDWIDALILAQFNRRETLTPMSTPQGWKKNRHNPPPPRSAKLAWAAAAIMFLGAGAVGIICQNIIAGERENSREIARKLEIVSLASNDLASQRDQLRSRLGDTAAELDKVQGELTVDRNVEDTLFKAVQAAHAARPSNANTVFADSAR